MNLVRSWLGQALRATGAAVMIPVSILVAVSLTGIGGSGLSGFGGLSQIVSGPEAAGSSVGESSDDEISEAVQQLAADRLAAAPADTLSGSGTPVGGGQGGGGDGGAAPGGGGGGGDSPGNDNGGDGPNAGPNPPDDDGGGGGGGGPPTPSDPDPPEPSEPGVMENLGDQVTDVTDGTPVDPTLEEAVDGLMETCRRVGCP